MICAALEERPAYAEVAVHKLVAGCGCCMHAVDDASMLSDLELTKQLDSSLLRCLEIFEEIGNCRCQMKIPLREVSWWLALPRRFSVCCGTL